MVRAVRRRPECSSANSKGLKPVHLTLNRIPELADLQKNQIVDRWLDGQIRTYYVQTETELFVVDLRPWFKRGRWCANCNKLDNSNRHNGSGFMACPFCVDRGLHRQFVGNGSFFCSQQCFAVGFEEHERQLHGDTSADEESD